MRASSFRIIGFALLLLATLARGLVAEGMMPDLDGGRAFGIRICDGGMAMSGMSMPGMKAMPAPAAPGKTSHDRQASCPFALAFLSAPVLSQILTALVAIFILIAYADRLYALARGERAASYRPRGPPAISA